MAYQRKVNRWRWVDKEELVKRIDRATQSAPKGIDKETRIDTGANDIISRIDRVSSRTYDYKALPVEAQEQLKKHGFVPSEKEQKANKVEGLKAEGLLPNNFAGA